MDQPHPIQTPPRSDTPVGRFPAGAPAAHDPQLVDLLRRHAVHPSMFLAYNSDTRHYRQAGLEGAIAFRPAGRGHVVQIFGPFGPEGQRRPLLIGFRDWSGERGRRVTAVQLLKDDARLYADEEFVVNQLGTSYSICLDGYTTSGTRFMKVRNKVSRAARAGVTVHEPSPSELDGLEAELAEIDRDWLHGKGAHELAFMIGERNGRGRPYRRVFVARHRARAVAYVTYSPCWGPRPGWLYDLTRRRPSAPAGTIELLFRTALAEFQAEGCEWLHLGLTPFAGLEDRHELGGRSSRVARAVVRGIASRGGRIYPAVSQQAFKLKWQPQLTEPEYVAFDRRLSAGAVWQLLRLTRTI